MQLANSQIHRSFHFGENPRSAGILSPKQEEEVSRNDTKAQRKSLFVAPLRRCVRLSFPFARSQAPALVVIHKCTHANILQPVGLPAISRGLSEATPPDNAEKRPTTPEGSQQSAQEPRHPSANAANARFRPMLSKAAQERLRPLRGRYFIRFAVRGCRWRSTPG